MITTIHGPMDEALLTPNHSVIDNENECTEITEYWLNGEIVHRSVAIQLKQNVFAEGAQGSFT